MLAEQKVEMFELASKSRHKALLLLKQSGKAFQADGDYAYFSPDSITPTFPVFCHGLNFIRVTQTDLPQTCDRLCRNHLDMSKRFESPKLPCDIPVSWFVPATFTIRVCDFHLFSMKIGVTEFWFYLRSLSSPKELQPTKPSTLWPEICLKLLRTKLLHWRYRNIRRQAETRMYSLSQAARQRQPCCKGDQPFQ